MGRGLLENVAERALGRAPSSPEHAVLLHLRALLNTRQGSSALDPAYGVPDLTEILHDLPRGMPAVQRAIAETIRRHEPRLWQVTVRPAAAREEGLALCFEIQAQLRSGQALRFQTQVACGGQIQVR